MIAPEGFVPATQVRRHFQQLCEQNKFGLKNGVTSRLQDDIKHCKTFSPAVWHEALKSIEADLWGSELIVHFFHIAFGQFVQDHYQHSKNELHLRLSDGKVVVGSKELLRFSPRFEKAPVSTVGNPFAFFEKEGLSINTSHWLESNWRENPDLRLGRGIVPDADNDGVEGGYTATARQAHQFAGAVWIWAKEQQPTLEDISS